MRTLCSVSGVSERPALAMTRGPMGVRLRTTLCGSQCSVRLQTLALEWAEWQRRQCSRILYRHICHTTCFNVTCILGQRKKNQKKPSEFTDIKSGYQFSKVPKSITSSGPLAYQGAGAVIHCQWVLGYWDTSYLPRIEMAAARGPT